MEAPTLRPLAGAGLDHVDPLAVWPAGEALQILAILVSKVPGMAPNLGPYPLLSRLYGLQSILVLALIGIRYIARIHGFQIRGPYKGANDSCWLYQAWSGSRV